MRRFFLVSALLEIPAGLAFFVAPLFQVGAFFGTTLDGPGGMALARLPGSALTAIGLACWFARRDAGSPAARGLAVAMLLYNASAVGLVLTTALVSHVSAIGLWPVAVIHGGMAVWCIACLRRRPDRPPAAASPKEPSGMPAVSLAGSPPPGTAGSPANPGQSSS